MNVQTQDQEYFQDNPYVLIALRIFYAQAESQANLSDNQKDYHLMKGLKKKQQFYVLRTHNHHKTQVVLNP